MVAERHLKPSKQKSCYRRSSLAHRFGTSVCHIGLAGGEGGGIYVCQRAAHGGAALRATWRGEKLKALCNQVGSHYPQRENFRLTPEVKDKFTEKLRFDPHEFCRHKLKEVVRKDGLNLIFEDGL